ATGPGSAAGFGRRLAALTADWLLGYLIAVLFLAGPDALASSSFSWTVLGIRVASLRSSLVGVPRAVLRTALIALVLPALARDADGRGWHDRAADTIV